MDLVTNLLGRKVEPLYQQGPGEVVACWLYHGELWLAICNDDGTIFTGTASSIRVKPEKK